MYCARQAHCHRSASSKQAPSAAAAVSLRAISLDRAPQSFPTPICPAVHTAHITQVPFAWVPHHSWGMTKSTSIVARRNFRHRLSRKRLQIFHTCTSYFAQTLIIQVRITSYCSLHERGETDLRRRSHEADECGRTRSGRTVRFRWPRPRTRRRTSELRSQVPCTSTVVARECLKFISEKVLPFVCG
jgi:hypothetical protein